MTSIDPITTEIIRNAFAAAAEDMRAALCRSAFSPVIYEMKDCSVAAWNTLITNVNVSAVSGKTITIAPDSSSTAAFTTGTLRSNFTISAINETAGSDAAIYVEEVVQGHPGL